MSDKFRSYLFLLIFSFVAPIILVNNPFVLSFKCLILWRLNIVRPFITPRETSLKHKFLPALLAASNIMLMEGLISLPLYSTASPILPKYNRRLITSNNPLPVLNSLSLIPKSL